MSPQPATVQQLIQIQAALEQQRDMKALECHSLERFKQHAPAALRAMFDEPMEKAADDPPTPCEILSEAAANYFTAKFNMCVFELQAIESRIQQIRQQQSGVVLASPALNIRK